MIAALLTGILSADPVRRDASNGNEFATATVREPAGETAKFDCVATFESGGMRAQLLLKKYATFATIGTPMRMTWINREGIEQRPSRLTAAEVMTVFQVRKRTNEA